MVRDEIGKSGEGEGRQGSGEGLGGGDEEVRECEE